MNTRVVGADGFTAFHRIKGKSYAKRSVGFGEYVMCMLPTKGPQHDALAKVDPRLAYGFITGYSKSSNEYYFFEGAGGKLTKAKSVQRVLADKRWEPEGLQAISITCQQLYQKRPARGVQVEGFPENPHAKAHEKGRVRVQRVWIYEDD